MSSLLDEIEERLRRLLVDLAAGDDIAPGALHRLEGLCEAAVLQQIISEVSLDDLADKLHTEILGEPMSARLGVDWRSHHPFPQLPLYMQRAPVLPST